jgi:MurNAc alpha-1-phosphate uridylyltransferase
MARAMLLAAGRGERMRPLTDTVPKPLLVVAGKPLIVWQIERLVRAGFDDLVINVSYRGEQIVDALGDGSQFGASIAYSREAEPLETAGGLAGALPLLERDGPDAPTRSVLVTAADVYAEFDYRRLAARVVDDDAGDTVHLVLVPNPPFRPDGDYTLTLGAQPGRVGVDGSPRWTWSGIGIFPISLLREIPAGRKIALLPFFADWIARGLVRGEVYRGPWDNLGTPEQLSRLDVSLNTSGGGASVT